MNLTTQETIAQVRDCFASARHSVIRGAELLYRIREDHLWDGNHQSFDAFVQDVCQISPSFATKLLKVYEHYVIHNSVSHAKLEGIDAEKLYLASRLEEEPERQLAKAETLTRSDLYDAIRENKNGAHECTPDPDIRLAPCIHCKKLIRV